MHLLSLRVPLLVLLASFGLSVLLLRISILLLCVGWLVSCASLVVFTGLCMVLMVVVGLYVLPLRVLFIGIVFNGVLTIVFTHVLVIVPVSILLFIGLLVKLLFTVLFVALLIIRLHAAFLVLHLHLLLLSQLLILVDHILHRDYRLTGLGVHATFHYFGRNLLLVDNALSIRGVRLLKVLLLRPLLRTCLFGLSLVCSGLGLVLNVETGLHKHDIGLLVKHKIFVFLDAYVRLGVFCVLAAGICAFVSDCVLVHFGGLVFGFFDRIWLAELGTF